MKIAQIAPLYESVPPHTYGGTERVVHYLTEALVRQGHEVTLYASADSNTSAELRAVVPEALRLSHEDRNPLTWHLLQLAQVNNGVRTTGSQNNGVRSCNQVQPSSHRTTGSGRTPLPATYLAG